MTPARAANRRPRRRRRSGTTLTEVLMALMVMGIGLVSVATLFPLSLLRSVEATKLTNATILRMNAEARLNASVGTDDYGNPIRRAIVEDPDNDGEVREHEGTRFFYDPLGCSIFGSDAPALAGSVGWVDTNGNGRFDAGTDSSAGIGRFWFDVGTRPNPTAAAAAAVTLPDSFITLADVTGAGASLAGTTLTIPGIDLREYPNTAVRVTLIRASVSQSLVFQDSPGLPVRVSGMNAVSLPAGTSIAPAFLADVGRITIETPENRYTWMATVRRSGLKPSVTVVVYFRRAYDPADERVYAVDKPPASYGEFELNLGLVDAGQSINNVNTAANGGPLPPGLRRGGWMFDASSFRWRKVVDFQPFKRGGADWVRITTDPEEYDLPKGFVYNPTPRLSQALRVMFPGNVVEAYTLKK